MKHNMYWYQLGVILSVLFSVGFAQTNLPSVSQTWKNANNSEYSINITGKLNFPYLVGVASIEIELMSGNGTIFFGIGQHRSNLTINMNKNSAPIFTGVGTAVCLFNGKYDEGYDNFFVRFESTTPITYTVNLIQTSTMLPLNTTIVFDISATSLEVIYHLVFYISPPAVGSPGHGSSTHNISIDIASNVPLSGFLSEAQIQARNGCIPGKNTTAYTLPNNTSYWTVLYQSNFDDAYNNLNYTLYLLPLPRITGQISSLKITPTVTTVEHIITSGIPMWAEITGIVCLCVVVVAVVIGFVTRRIMRNRRAYSQLN